MHVRCPNCQGSLEFAGSPPGSLVTCPACGTRLSAGRGSEQNAYAGAEANDAETLSGTMEMRGAQPPSRPLVGPAPRRRFGDYELIDLVARGGMGVVYKAWQLSLDRIVAIKMILAGQLASEAAVERFHAEAQAAARLTHQGIVPIYESGTRDGQHYYSMGFVEGKSLASRLAAGPLRPTEAAQLVQKIAEAVEYAHGQGIIHRDIKPDNVLMDERNEPHLIDFGLAKLVGAESHLTASGQTLGTPSYMPPEQAAGRGGQIGIAADVYGLGATLYALLVGRPPFQADSALETLKQVVERAPLPPRQLNRSVDLNLNTICLKCLEKEPRRRYPTAGAVAEDLDRYLRGEPIRARHVPSIVRAWQWCRRKPLVAGLSSAVIGLLLFLAIAGPLAAVAQVRSRRAAEHAEAQTRRRLYVSDMNLAIQAWDSGNVRRVLDLLERHRPASGGDDLRGFEWYYLWQLCQRGTNCPSLYHGSAVYALAYSPDGRTLATSSWSGDIKLWNVATGRVQASLKPHTDRVLTVAFSPDGKLLASAGWDEVIKVWNLEQDREQATLKGHRGWITRLAFSPDGRVLASAGSDRGIRLWEVGTEKPARILDQAKELINCVAFSPDGSTLALGAADGTLSICDTATGDVRATLTGHTGDVYAVEYLDQTRLASAGADNAVRVWDPATGQERLTLRGHTQAVLALAYSQKGDVLASAGDDNSVRLWNLDTGKEKETLKGHAGTISSVDFSPDGGTLASASYDDTVKLWELAPLHQRSVLDGHSAAIYALAFAPDGQSFVTGSWDRTVKLWDTATGQQIRTIQREPVDKNSGAVLAFGYSSDGRLLAMARSDKNVVIWNLSGRQPPRVLKGHSDMVFGVAFSPDDRILASASWDGTVMLWNTRSGNRLTTFKGHTSRVHSVSFSPDGKVLASASWDGTVRLWDTVLQSPRCNLEGHAGRVWFVTFSPDGTLLASASADRTVRLWDVASQQQRAVLSGHSGFVFCAAFSPDGGTLASAGTDRTIKLWDVATREERATLSGHTGPVFKIAFSGDGKTLASVSEDNTVRLWHAAGNDQANRAD